jgi:hypothetical protein
MPSKRRGNGEAALIERSDINVPDNMHRVVTGGVVINQLVKASTDPRAVGVCVCVCMYVCVCVCMYVCI